MHSLICSLCMYWAPACNVSLAIKVLLLIHSSVYYAHIECLLFARHWALSQATAEDMTVWVSDFMELSFAFRLLHQYTGSSQPPLGRGNFHFLFTNEHSEGWSRWVICSGWAESKLEPGFPIPNAALQPGPSSRAFDGSLLPLAENTLHHAGVMQQGQVGLGGWERTCSVLSACTALAKNYHHRMLPSQAPQ